MSESLTRQRSDYWAGFCTLLLLASVLALTIVIGYFRENPSGTQNYEVFFSIDNGVEGVQAGSRILYGGLDIGQVEQVRYKDNGIYVTVGIDEGVRLHPGVQVRRAGSLLGGAATIVVENTGDLTAKPLGTGSQIRALPPATGTSNLLGQANASRLTRIEDSIAMAVSGMEEIRNEAGDIAATRDQLQQLAETMQADFDQWQPKLERIQETLGVVDTTIMSLNEQRTPIRESMTRVTESLKVIQAQFEGPTWEALTTDFEQLSTAFDQTRTEFEEQVLPLVEELITNGEASWTNLLRTMNAVEKLGGNARRTLNTFMANSTLAAQQLALTEQEVLGALGLPLLERPSQSDQELMIRQESMEEWARSATTIRELLKMIDSVKLEGLDDPTAAATLKSLEDALGRVLADYEQMQKRYFDSNAPAPDGK